MSKTVPVPTKIRFICSKNPLAATPVVWAATPPASSLRLTRCMPTTREAFEPCITTKAGTQRRHRAHGEKARVVPQCPRRLLWDPCKTLLLFLYLGRETLVKIITWEVWITYGVKPCDRCKRFDGRLYCPGEGPQPVHDTHYGCQCQRAFHHFEVQPDAQTHR